MKNKNKKVVAPTTVLGLLALATVMLPH